MFDLTGKIAVVTGGSSGLGVQFAHALGRQGATVIVVARRTHLLEKVAADIAAESGVKTGWYYCDLTRSELVKALADKIEADYGRIDIAVNCAGGGNCDWSEKISDEKWHKTMDININGLFYCCREFGRIMIEHGYGRMINISSMLGSVGIDVEFGMGIPEYAASKGAVNNLTRQLAIEWARYGLTVNAIAPGFFPSEVSPVGNEKFENFLKMKCPMKRAGRAGELDSTVVYLASEESSYVTGQIVGVDGGWTGQ